MNKNFIRMTELMKYDREKTFTKFDEVSFEDFANAAKLPAEMRLMFTTFSRAFFAEPQYISMGELIKSFHFYFLSNDHGLIYDVLNDDFEITLWNPIKKYLEVRNGRILLNTPIKEIQKKDSGKFIVNGEDYDYIIIASDIPGTKNIISNSHFIKTEYKNFYNKIQQLKKSQKYAVLRIWIDKDLKGGLPFFIFTDAIKILDSVTIYHQMEKTSAEWVKKNGGGIFELHYFPEIKDFNIKYEYLQVRDDFTAFHTNLFKNRPAVKTEIKNLYLAGDWVKLDTPAMLMEAAATSALTAVNEILKTESLREDPVYSVPLKGLFA